MKKRLWRLISMLLIFILGFAGPLANLSYAVPEFDFSLSTEPYVEFTPVSMGAITVNTVDQIKFRVQGDVVSTVIHDDTDDEVRDFAKTFAVRLTEDGQVKEIGMAKGVLRDSADPSVIELIIDLGQVVLNSNSTYKIDFLTPTVKTLLNEVGKNIFDPQSGNVQLELYDSGAGSPVDTSVHDFDNPSVTSGSTPTIQEFNGSDQLVISGPQIKADLGDLLSLSMDPITKVELRLEGEFQLTSPGAINVNLGTVQSPDLRTAEFSTLNGSGPYIYGIKNVSDFSGFNASSTEIVFQGTDDTFEDIQKLAHDYIMDNTKIDKGNVYILGYNSSDEVVGYKLFRGIDDTQLYIDPTFEISDQQPPFVGFFDMQGSDPDKPNVPDLEFIYTGQNQNPQGPDELFVDGSTAYTGGTSPIVFELKLYESHMPGDYELIDFGFRDMNFTDPNNNDFEIRNVPVNVFEKNTVTISGKGSLSSENIQFTWEPDQTSIENFLNGAFTSEHKVGSGTDIKVNIPKYNGALSNMKMELVQYVNTSPTLVATYDASAKVPSTEPNQENNDVITFTQSSTQPTSAVGFGGIDPNGSMRIEVIYDNSNITLGPVRKQLTNNLEVDSQPPMVHVNGLDFYDGSNLYKFIVDFGDEVDLTNISNNLSDFFTLDHDTDPLSGINISGIEGYRFDYENAQTNDPFRGALISINGKVPYRTQLSLNGTVEVDGNGKVEAFIEGSNLVLKGIADGTGTLDFHLIGSGGADIFVDDVTYQVGASNTTSATYFINTGGSISLTPADIDSSATGFFTGIEDIFGNAIVMTQYSELNLETQLDTFIIDKNDNDNYLVNTELRLVPLNQRPQPVSGGAIQWDQIIHLSTNDTGNVKFRLYPDTYLAFEKTQKNTNGSRTEESVDFEFTIPVMTNSEKYTTPIELPEDNVSGSSTRDNLVYQETLVFVESGQLSNLEAAIANPDDWGRFEILKMFYLKQVETDGAGNYSTYMRPGDYYLVGKIVGEAIVEPDTVGGTDYTGPRLVQVPSNGNVTFPTVEFPPPTLVGTIHDSGNNPLPFVFVDFKGNQGNQFRVATDANGAFAANIDIPDTYALTAVYSDWNVEGTGILYINESGFGSPAVITTNIANGTDSAANMNTITLPATNYVVNFAIGSTPVAAGEFGSVNISKQVGQNEFAKTYHVPTQSGGFNMYLPNASYQINEFNYGELWVTPETLPSFTVSGSGTFNIDLINYFNGLVNLKDEDNQPLAGYRIEVFNQFNNRWNNAVTNDSGNAYFKFEVPEDANQNATIKLQAYDYKGKWTNLFDQNLTFTVNKNQLGSTMATYNLVVKKPNFKGHVYTGDPITSGVGYDENTKITDGNLNVRYETTDPSLQQWFNVWIDQNGLFETNLPYVGKYIIESANDHGSQSWFEIQKPIWVAQSGNSLIVVDPIDQSTPLADSNGKLHLGKQAPNLTGNLYKSQTGTDTYLPSSSVPSNEYHVALLVREKNIPKAQYDFEPWLYEVRLQVTQDTGAFSANLDPSKSYEAYAVETSRGWVEFSTPVDVSIQNGLVIRPPVANVNGSVKEFGNIAITGIRHGRVEIEKADGSKWVSAHIDDTGNFGIQLPGPVTGSSDPADDDDAKYIIREYGFEKDDGQGNITHHHFRVNREFVVGTNSEAISLAPNFKLELSDPGSTVITAPTNQQDNFFNANIRPVLQQSDFIDKYPNDANFANSEFQRYQLNPWEFWEFNIWVEGKYNNGKLEFFTNLTEGEYELLDVHGHNLNLEIGKKFILSSTAPLGVTYDSNANNYLMELSYTANVKGSIQENNSAISKAWVNFMRTDLDWDDYTTRRWFGTQTNDSGVFALNLPIDEQAGKPKDDDDTTAQYKFEGYHSEGQWTSNGWEPGKWVPVGLNFLIQSDGSLTDMDGNAYPNDELVIAPNVTGEIYKIFKAGVDNANDFEGTPSDGAYAKSLNGWLNIWPYDSSDPNYQIPWEDWEKSIWTHVSGNGQFNLMLDTGEYIVTEVGMPNFWYRPDLVFEIDSSGDLVTNSNVVNGVLQIKPEQPNFKGTAYSNAGQTKALEWGWMMLRPATSGNDDWTNTVWINTDGQGYFETKLADGNWKIVEMGNYGFHQRIVVPFNIAGSTITASAPGIVIGNDLTIYPPDPNVVGIIKDKAGNQLQTKAWLTIKPASASDYEWENASWAEYKLYDNTEYRFKLNLDPGDYKVIEFGSYDLFHHTDIRFTVNSDLSITSSSLANGLLEVQPPQPNFTGTVYGDIDNDNNDEPVGNGWIGVARYQSGVQVTLEGNTIPSTDYKDEWSNMYWQHTRWTETNDSGKFEMNLEDGTYQVIGVGGQGVWYQPRIEFTIETGEITVLDITEPGPNVTITVTGVPTEMQASNYAWLDVFRTVGGNKLFEPVDFISKSGDTFTFKGNLPNDTYTIGFFGTDFGGIEIDDVTMTVNGTTTKSVAVGSETGKQIVQGQISVNSTAITEKAWIKIEGTVNGESKTKKTQTDANGNFKFKLPDNTDWRVTEISLKQGYLLLPNEAQYQFNSGTGSSPSSAWDINVNITQ